MAAAAQSFRMIWKCISETRTDSFETQRNQERIRELEQERDSLLREMKLRSGTAQDR